MPACAVIGLPAFIPLFASFVCPRRPLDRTVFMSFGSGDSRGRTPFKIEGLCSAVLCPCLVEPADDFLRLDPKAAQGEQHCPNRHSGLSLRSGSSALRAR